MYNGIGLTTARGSGTNGYVQKSLAVNRFRDDDFRDRSREPKSDPLRKADAGILEHERKRKVEVKCMELRMELEDKGVNEEEIENEVSQLRSSLSASGGEYTHDEAKALRPSDVHARAAAKAKELENFGKALGVRSDYQIGQAFDRDLQEQRKQDRMEARKAKQEAWQRKQEEREQMMKERAQQRESHPRERGDFDRGFGRGGGGGRVDTRDNSSNRRGQDYGPPRDYEPRRRSPPRDPARGDTRRHEADHDRRRPSPPPRDAARSPSPSPRRGSSRSPSPERRRGDTRSRSITPSSPPPRRRYDSRTPEQESRARIRRDRSPSYSRSPTPEARSTSRRYDDHDDPRRERDPAGSSRAIRRPDVDDDEGDRRKD